MNVSGTKKLMFNKSSLLNLKAELSKKKEEIAEKKQSCQPPIINKSVIKKQDSKIKKSTTLKDKLNEKNSEELELLRKSKLALEKKSALYEHLSDKAGNSQLESKFLVDFSTKKNEEDQQQHDISIKKPIEINNWELGEDNVEFTDHLGRTRKCRKADLDLYQKQDEELRRLSLENNEGVSQEAAKVEKPFLVQKTNEYLQTLRDKWEEKERELLAQDRDVHYQDLLFDEARMHGVGYFAFSTDEAERKRQMEELLRTRAETLEAQKTAEETRTKREEIMAARVAATRARRRLRAGLPPEDPEEVKKQYTEKLLELLNKKKNEAELKAKEEEAKRKEEIEKERQKIRESYVREWDKGKDGKEIPRFKTMTQEEYVEQQRSKRIKEFAPPQEINNASSSSKTWSDVRPHRDIVIDEPIEDAKGLYFTSSKNKVKYRNFVQALESNFNESSKDEVRPNTSSSSKNENYNSEENRETKNTSNKRKEVKYRNFVKEPESTPIINELSDEESESNTSSTRKRTKGAEIEPPPTYAYYMPTSKIIRTEVPFHSDIREAYAQGAKSLTTKESKRQLSKDYDFVL